MRVIVTGGDGYLGWPQAMYLSKRGYDVCVVDNFSRRLWDLEGGTESLIPIAPLHDRVAAWREKSSVPMASGSSLKRRRLQCCGLLKSARRQGWRSGTG